MDALMLPSNWQKVRLGDIGKPCMCKRVMKHQTTRYGEIPFYKIGTFGNTADAFISKKLFLEYQTKYSFPKKGDILISASGTIGRAVIYDGKPAYFQDSNIVWIDNDETLVKNDFLFYAYSNVKWNTEHTTILRLYNDNFKNTLIPLPPLNEQSAIADILSALDNYLHALRALILKKESVKKALSFELLSQRKRLKGFNQAWQRVRLGDIAEINPPTIIPNVFYYIDLENVEKGQLLNKQLMTKNKAPSRARRLLSKNDILYQLVRPYQRNNYFFTLNGNYVASTGYAQIRTLQNPSFLYFALHSNYFVNAVLDRCEGTSYPAISSNELKKCEVILPPLNEQIAIADILSDLDRYLHALNSLILKKESVKKALSHDLMSAKIRVLKK
ncbi:restriction endonuclease subunit S [Helicobacter pylori]|uniref:restriction endonuclease subunit S n=1 Tax=Helicobacter pylori TaxID=210 RepID=UPI0036F21380